MSAFVVIDASCAVDRARNHTRARTAIKRKLKAKIKSALTFAGGKLGKYTRGSRFVAEFENQRQANEAIALIQRSRIGADLAIGQDSAALVGRRSSKWLRHEPVTKRQSTVWAPRSHMPVENEYEAAFRDYRIAADVLSAPLIAEGLTLREARAFRLLGTHLDEARAYIPRQQAKGLAAVGIEWTKDGPDVCRLVYFWKDSSSFARDHVDFRGKRLQVRNEVSGEFLLQVNKKERPFFLGCCISRVGANSSAGSIGCIVRTRDDPTSRYLLSASHVMGEGPYSMCGASVIQPAQKHGGNAIDVIGKVEFASPLRGYPFENMVDAAYARIHPTQFISTVGFKGPMLAGVGKPAKDKRIWKVGAGNGGPHSAVVNIRFPTFVAEDREHNRNLIYRDVWACSPGYSEDGDSGCAIIEEQTNHIVGLHLAGNRSTSCFLDITTIFDDLNLELVL